MTQPTRAIRLADRTSQALVYPEHGFQLHAFDVEIDGVRVETIHGPGGAREPADRRYGNPVLFPNPGVANGSRADHWDHQGHALLMPQHGWARNVYWHVTDVDARSVTGVLTPNPQLRLAFPFNYELVLRYELDGATLALHTALTNTGAEPFPYALGFHPYLRAPLGPRGAREGCDLKLPAGSRLVSGDGWRTINRAPWAARTIAAADPELGQSIVLADSGARALELVDRTSGLALQCSVEDSEQSFPIWVAWSASSESPYVCPEPWTDFPNALNRSGTRTLDPGATHRYSMKISLRRLDARA